MKKITLELIIILLYATFLCGCKENKGPKNPLLDLETPVTLTLAAPWSECKALDKLSGMFSKKYPNVTIKYEYVQDYYASLAVRLDEKEEKNEKVDIFITTNIQESHPLYNCALELSSKEEFLDLSGTFPGLVNNFSVTNSDFSKSLYSIPLGAEMRGMLVNKTLLNEMDIKVPTNINELESACEELKSKGYIPLQGNPGSFGQILMYPYICNIIVNSENSNQIKADITSCSDNTAQYFQKPLEKLYSFVKNGYYNYKYVETELGLFTDASDEATARYFLDIGLNDGEYSKNSDLGKVAFLPVASSFISTVEQTKADYHSDIEYEFILSPVGENSGFAYMSPTHGIAIGKNSDHLDWAVEFMNYLFAPENNKIFASEYNCTANTKDAFSEITKSFSVSEDCISELGQATFNYSFYNVINKVLVEMSKSNNPKYMIEDKDGNKVMQDFEYYMNKLNELIIENRSS